MMMNWKKFGRKQLSPDVGTILALTQDTEENHENPQ
jgi:hypothetical protein